MDTDTKTCSWANTVTETFFLNSFDFSTNTAERNRIKAMKNSRQRSGAMRLTADRVTSDSRQSPQTQTTTSSDQTQNPRSTERSKPQGRAEGFMIDWVGVFELEAARFPAARSDGLRAAEMQKRRARGQAGISGAAWCAHHQIIVAVCIETKSADPSPSKSPPPLKAEPKSPATLSGLRSTRLGCAATPVADP